MALPNGYYNVGWICAHESDQTAARTFLDEEHGAPINISKRDATSYNLGRMGHHNVVIAMLPSYGMTSATSAARDMVHTFPNIRIGLMVGTAGGAPTAQHDIRLGDVVVSRPANRTGGVLQYDFGKRIQEGKFQPSGHLNSPPMLLLSAISGLAATFVCNGNPIAGDVEQALRKRPPQNVQRFRRPDPTTDQLYKSNVVHPVPQRADQRPESCATACGNDASKLVVRRPRTSDDKDPQVFTGIIGSGNVVMKNAMLRDAWAQEQGVLCFEMEAAGLMNNFPCLVVRGISNYADTHKNDTWRGYAAMSAAAYAKALLAEIALTTLEFQQRQAKHP